MISLLSETLQRTASLFVLHWQKHMLSWIAVTVLLNGRFFSLWKAVQASAARLQLHDTTVITDCLCLEEAWLDEERPVCLELMNKL